MNIGGVRRCKRRTPECERGFRLIKKRCVYLRCPHGYRSVRNRFGRVICIRYLGRCPIGYRMITRRHSKLCIRIKPKKKCPNGTVMINGSCVTWPPKTCFGRADIAFLLDSSKRVGKQRFTMLKKFITDTLTGLGRIDHNNLQVAVIRYSEPDAIDEIIHLNSYRSMASLSKAIMAIPYNPGKSFTAKALNKLRSSTFSPIYGARDLLPKIAVLITDDVAADRQSLALESRMTRFGGIRSFAVGVGKNFDKNELLKLTGHESRTLFTSFSDLRQNAKILRSKICELVGPRPKPKPKPCLVP